MQDNRYGEGAKVSELLGQWQKTHHSKQQISSSSP